MLVSEDGEVAMNLIGHHDEVVSLGKVSQTDECFSVPHNAARVVRVGEDEQTAFLVAHFFKMVEIHLVSLE